MPMLPQAKHWTAIVMPKKMANARLDEGDERQDHNRDHSGRAEGADAAPVCTHGLVAAFVALGDGQQAGSPQRAAHRDPGGEHGHDAVTQEADEVGTAGVEDDDFVRTAAVASATTSFARTKSENAMM